MRKEANAARLKEASVDELIFQHLKETFQSIVEDFFKDEAKFRNIENSAFQQVTSVLRSNRTTAQDFGALDFEQVQQMICCDLPPDH